LVLGYQGRKRFPVQNDPVNSSSVLNTNANYKEKIQPNSQNNVNINDDEQSWSPLEESGESIMRNRMSIQNISMSTDSFS
jgi:hypothetical protein